MYSGSFFLWISHIQVSSFAVWTFLSALWLTTLVAGRIKKASKQKKIKKLSARFDFFFFFCRCMSLGRSLCATCVAWQALGYRQHLFSMPISKPELWLSTCKNYYFFFSSTSMLPSPLWKCLTIKWRITSGLTLVKLKWIVINIKYALVQTFALASPTTLPVNAFSPISYEHYTEGERKLIRGFLAPHTRFSIEVRVGTHRSAGGVTKTEGR